MANRSSRIRYATSVCTCFIIVLALSISIAPVYGASTATVSGRCIDESSPGGIDNVLIKVYTYSTTYAGAYVKNGTTSSGGYFAIDLDVGASYVLYFSKEAYVEVTKTINLSSGLETLNLGDIALPRTLGLSSQALGRVASPGDTLRFSFTVSNAGKQPMTVELLVTAPENWTTRTLLAAGNETAEITNVYLLSGASVSPKLEVTIPSTANGSYSLSLTASGETSSTLTFTIDVRFSYALGLETSTLLTSATTGGSTTFTAKITNTGKSTVTGVSVSVDAPSGWESSITPVQVNSLEPKGSSTFTIVVKVPGDAVAGDYMITLRGLSDKVKSDSVQVRVTVTAPTSWGLIGVGIAVVMVAALLMIFRRFRRR